MPPRSDDSVPPPAGQRGRASHRDELLAAARRLLRTKGYADTTARDLAAESGTHLGSIGYHFGSKEALLCEAMHEEFQLWTRRLGEIALSAEGATPLERLGASWRAMVDEIPDYRELLIACLDALAAAARRPELRARVSRQYAETREAVRDTLTAALGPDDTGQHELVAMFLVAVCDGLMVQYLLDPERFPTGDALVSALAHTLDKVALTAPASSP
jgi:AcrR family transcriptional regulator